MKLAVQKILCNILRIFSLPGTTTVVVFYSRFDVSGPTNTQHALVIDMYAIVVSQIVIEPPIALIWTFLMNFLNLVGQTLILIYPMAQFP